MLFFFFFKILICRITQENSYFFNEKTEIHSKNRFYRTFQHRAKISNCLKKKQFVEKGFNLDKYPIFRKSSIIVLSKKKKNQIYYHKSKTIKEKTKVLRKNRNFFLKRKKDKKKNSNQNKFSIFRKKQSKETRRKISQSLILRKIMIEEKKNPSTF